MQWYEKEKDHLALRKTYYPGPPPYDECPEWYDDKSQSSYNWESCKKIRCLWISHRRKRSSGCLQAAAWFLTLTLIGARVGLLLVAAITWHRRTRRAQLS